MRQLTWIGVASVSAVFLVSGTACATGDRVPVTVDRVVDGDTIDVREGDDTGRVRLLNVDTPETKHPEKEIECL